MSSSIARSKSPRFISLWLFKKQDLRNGIRKPVDLQNLILSAITMCHDYNAKKCSGRISVTCPSLYCSQGRHLKHTCSEKL